MRNRTKIKQTKKHNFKKIISSLMIIATLFMCIGYASINSITMQLTGVSYASSPKEVFIQDALITSNNEADLNDSDILLYSGTMLNSKVSLSSTNINSTLTMTVTVRNTTDKDYIFAGITYGDEFYIDDNGNLNTSMDYQVINTTNETNMIVSGEQLVFTLIFKYSDDYKELSPSQPYQNILNSYLNFNFIEIPVLELSNEDEVYTDKIYPGLVKEYEFIVSNYNGNEINSVPMTYYFETTTDELLTVKIYDVNDNEVTGNIIIDGDGTTRIEHIYTLKLIWDKGNEEINYDEYKNKEFKSNILLKATPDSEKTLDYLLTKEFNIETTVSPLYFNVSANTNINMEKAGATLPITIKNYNSETEYNEFETKYQIIVEGNDKFEVTVDNQSLSNNTIEKTLSGGSKTDNKFNILFNADINTLDLSENIILKIIPISPYIDEEITLVITIKLQPVTITFNATGGTVSPSTKIVYKGKTYEDLPTPTWKWHTFNGWYTSETGGTKISSTSEVTTSNATQTLYAQWTSHLLVDYVSTGDYVNYNIKYNNVATNSNGTHYASLTGWRVLDTQTDENGDKYVRLIPAGVPMAYRHAATSTTSGQTGATNLTTNFFNTAISSTGASNVFNACGFQNNLGTIIGISTLKDLFLNNEYTQIKNGVPVVRSIMKEDIESVMKITVSNSKDIRGNDLFAIPSSDQASAYASYYLANAESGYYLWVSYFSGHIVYTYAYMGVRPIVSLKPEVLTSGQTNNVWQINIE